MKKKITKSEVKHIADLSKLSFSDSESERMQGHLDTVLGYFEQLDSVDTSDVSPTAHILDKVNVLRADVAKESMPREQLLANAPEKNDECYIVPRVVE